MITKATHEPSSSATAAAIHPGSRWVSWRATPRSGGTASTNEPIAALSSTGPARRRAVRARLGVACALAEMALMVGGI